MFEFIQIVDMLIKLDYNLVKNRGVYMVDFGALNRIGRDIRKNFEPKLNIKLRGREVHLLSMIQKHPGEPFIFYSEGIGLERSSFSYLSEVLELKGLIERKDLTNDKRTKTMVLTKAGEQIANEIERQFQEYLEKLLSVLTKEEVTRLDDLVEELKKIAKKMNNNEVK